MGQDEGKFFYPKAGLATYYLDTVQFAYTSEFPNPFLFLWCRDPTLPMGQRRQVRYTSRVTPFSGTQQVVLNFQINENCYGQLKNNATKDPKAGFKSAHFQHVAVEGSRMLWTLDSSSDKPPDSSSSTPAALTDTSAAAATDGGSLNGTDTQQPPPPPQQQQGLSPGALAGIVTGVALVGIVLGALVVMGLLRHRRRKRAAAAAEDEAKMNDDSMASHWFPTSHSKELGAWRDPAEVYGSTKGASSPETMMYPYTGSGGVTPWGPIEMADPAAADGGVYDGGMVPGFVEAPAQVALKMGAGGWDYAPKEMLPMSVMGMAAPNMQQVHYMQTEVDGGLLEKGAMPLQDMKSKVYPLPGLDEAGGYPSPPASMPASALPPNSAGSMPEQGEEVPAEVHQLPVPEDSWPVESHKFRFPPP